MISRARFLGASVVVLLSLGGVACGDTSAEDGGDGGRGGSTTRASSVSGSTTTQATSSTTQVTSTTDATSTDVSSSATVMPMPCVPPGVDGMAPTPGVCMGNTAVVCDAATSMIVERACAADEACKVYALTEHTFDGVNTLDWVETGTVEWAACLPADATPCSMVFNGSSWASESYDPQCQGEDRTYCGIPPFPDAVPGNGQKLYGNTEGYVHVVPCPSGDVCRAPLQGPVVYFDALKCFDAAAAPCSAASSTCDGQTVTTCEAGYGYETRIDCATGGNVCMIGCDSTFGTPIGQCVPPGTQSCDPMNPPAVCDTQDTFTSCHQCLTSPNDCSVLTSIDLNGNTVVNPGDCVVGDSGPRCVIEGTPLCDTSAPEICDGNVAKRCFDGVQYDFPCVGTDVCRLGSNGEAGCTFPTAAACADADAESCTGDVLHSCCPDSGFLHGIVPYPCAPGFEATLDCTDIAPNMTCADFGNGFAHCNGV